jgi:hypothetical protein
MDWGDGVGDGQQDERGPKGDAVEVGGQWRDDGRGMAGQEKIGEWSEQGGASDSQGRVRKGGRAIDD